MKTHSTSNCPSLFQPSLISCSHFYPTYCCACIRFPFFMPLATHMLLIKLNDIPRHRMVLQGDRLGSTDLFNLLFFPPFPIRMKSSMLFCSTFEGFFSLKVEVLLRAQCQNTERFRKQAGYLLCIVHCPS